MTNLFSRYEINGNETLGQEVKKVEILFDLKGDIFEISDLEFDKKIVCVCGSCDLQLTKGSHQEKITINNPEEIIMVNSDIKIELRSFTKNTKVVVEYLLKGCV